MFGEYGAQECKGRFLLVPYRLMSVLPSSPKFLGASTVLFAGIALGGCDLRPATSGRGPLRWQSAARHRPTRAEPFHVMRNLAFGASNAESRAGTDESDVLGLVVDWGTAEAVTATIVCMADGTVSMYVSTGSGVLGAGEHESVRTAAHAALLEAVAVRSWFRPIDRPPQLPEVDTMRFTLVTSKGLESVNAGTLALMQGKSPLSKLGNAVQRVIWTITQATSPPNNPP